MERTAFPVAFGRGSYDLKKFLRDHPGGVNTLKTFKGKSIKNAMVKFGHSANAYHLLSDLKVEDSNLTGELSGCNGRIITNSEDTLDDGEVAFLEELESRLDWSKAILSQLGAIAPHYDRWVNTAVYRDCRLFANPLLEALTYTAWYFVPLFWIPIIVYLAVTEYKNHVECGETCIDPPISCWEYLSHLARGVLLWSALEYSMHRWLFHLDPGSSVYMIKAHFVLHGLHHKVPFDSYRQVFPPIPAFVITCVLYPLLRPFLTRPMLKLTGVLIVVVASQYGLAGAIRDVDTRKDAAAHLPVVSYWIHGYERRGYLTYDMIHCYVHRGNPAPGSYLYAMKRYHSNHHFINPDKAFGISSKLWDYVFRTIVNVKKLNFNLNWNY